jgi:FixJ family two-component response regulator
MIRNELTSPSVPVVYVVDDDASVLESLESLIGCAGWRAATFASAQQFLSQPPGQAPHCLVLDSILPDISGLELQSRIARSQADLPIIFISAYDDVTTTASAMKGGAVEFLTKPFANETLLDAIRYAIDRSRALLDGAVAMGALAGRYKSLTRREREIMRLVAAGRMNKQIADDLGISEVTVKAHRGKLMHKMQADSLADLVRMAMTLGLVITHHANHRPAP